MGLFVRGLFCVVNSALLRYLYFRVSACNVIRSLLLLRLQQLLRLLLRGLTLLRISRHMWCGNILLHFSSIFKNPLGNPCRVPLLFARLFVRGYCRNDLLFGQRHLWYADLLLIYGRFWLPFYLPHVLSSLRLFSSLPRLVRSCLEFVHLVVLGKRLVV